MSLPIAMDIYRTAIPMRSFEHAAARRDIAEAVVTRLQLADGSVGWGETLPRQYVTGETLESVVADLEQIIWPACRSLSPQSPGDLRAIPRQSGGRCINAAACAMELAFVSAQPGLLGNLAGKISARVSGVLGSADPAKTAKRLRLMRWFGLRDFKLKLGFGDDTDAANLAIIHRRLGRAISAGRCTLRVDVNGGWSLASAPDRVAALKQYGVCVVEQPVFCTAGKLAELAQRCALPLMADESLLTPDDAKILADQPKVWWNIRISKNGGIGPSLDLARMAAQKNIPFVIGAMVGESGILSAAQRRLLQCCPPPRFVEGNYGKFLLADDLTKRSPRFGYAGRLSTLRGPGLGAEVLESKVQQYSTGKTIRAASAPGTPTGG